MERVDINGVLSHLKERCGCVEAYQVTAFKAYRPTTSGQPQAIVIEILDAGPDKSAVRYRCIATAANGRAVSSQPGATLPTVLSQVRWTDLD